MQSAKDGLNLKKNVESGKSVDLIDFEKKTLYLQAQKLFIDDSFDFTVESVGQFTNMDVVF